MTMQATDVLIPFGLAVIGFAIMCFKKDGAK